MKKYKLISRLFYASAVLFYVAAILPFVMKTDTSMSVVYFCIGIGNLCLGSVYLNKSKGK